MSEPSGALGRPVTSGRHRVSEMIQTSAAGKKYGRQWALRDCTLAIPDGKVVGLVGPNGAGKSTLLQLAAGLLRPTSGTITVLGGRPGTSPGQLAKVGFVAQDAPVYGRLSVAGHLRMGAWLNPGWDGEVAERRVAQLGLERRQRAGSLSGGQRAQLASRWRSRNGPSCFFSMSRWPALTPSPGASSCRASWRSSPSTGPASCSPRT